MTEEENKKFEEEFVEKDVKDPEIIDLQIPAPKLTRKEMEKVLGIWIGISLGLNLLSLYAIAVFFAMPIWFIAAHSALFYQLGISKSATYKKQLLDSKFAEQMVNINKIIDETIKKHVANKTDTTSAGGNSNNTQV